MTGHDSRFLGSEPVAARTAEFRFARPADFRFRAGQTIDLTLPSAGQPRHTFSLVSAPDEPVLTIATRQRGASDYKRALAGLAAGAPVKIDGPYGSFALHSDALRPALFVAGGIGVTPYISMLRQAERARESRSFVLLYSNRLPEDAAFLEELRALERRMRSFRLVATMTAMSRLDAVWTGPAGRIGEALLRDALQQAPGAVAYVTGSPAFVKSLCDGLVQAGLPEDEIRSEEFFGY